MDPRVTSKGLTITLSSTSPIRMPWLTRRGPEKIYQQRPSGSSQRAVGVRTTNLPGGTSSCPANTWQGEFPVQKNNPPGQEYTSPVRAYPANSYGVYDMIGNVWEWTTDWFSAKHAADAPKACCVPENPRGGSEIDSYDPRQPNIKIPRKVLKGGSHLCAPNYCRRYRPAARHAQPVDTSTSHVGFRCVVREGHK